MSLTDVLRVAEQACKKISPVVAKLYNRIDATIVKEKEDKSVFTVADGLVQNMLTRLLQPTQMKIVGEEDVKVQLDAPPYTVDKLPVPEELYPDMDELKAGIAELAESLQGHKAPHLVAFIDPIDGTREFSTGLGEQCSICLGIAREGRAVAGIVYRPLSEPPTYASGCKEEGYVSENLTRSPAGGGGAKLLTTNGRISPFMEACLDKLGAERVRTGGAGNKALMLLERAEGCMYFQDRGLSRWDTCAAQAILDAKGGTLVKLSTFLATGELVPYKYLASDKNEDFTPSEAKLTAYNATDVGQAGQVATCVSQVRPYSNLAGLFASTTKDLVAIAAVRSRLQEAAKVHPPSFD